MDLIEKGGFILKSKTILSKVSIILIVLMFSFVAIITGCASSEPTSGNEVNKEVEKDSEWERVVKEAKKEGKVVILGPPGNLWREALTAPFQKAFPEIEVDFQGMSGRDLGPKLINEQKADKYLVDLTVGGPNTALNSLIPANALDAIPRDLPNTKPTEVNEKKWHSGFEFGFMDSTNKFIYAFHGEYVTVFIDRNQIPESELKTAQDLLKPEFSGKIVWNSPSRAGAGSFMGQTFVAQEGADFLEKLMSTQEIVVTDDLRQQADWIIRGVYPIAIGTSRDMMQDFKNKGLGKNVVAASDPSLKGYSQGFGTVTLVKNAPNPNAAKVFINWLLSEEGQIAIGEITKLNSRLLSVPVMSEDTYVAPDEHPNFMGKEENTKYLMKALEIAKRNGL